ncbi:hypothetical protein ACFPPE_05630 [Agromyces tardus]|uniref:hypothetical protein n=1 Tax=Agromyces tardus TaxID=2583849 RepID=UPI00110C5026|nr:hypothetical protein [Agromyces tardus]
MRILPARAARVLHRRRSTSLPARRALRPAASAGSGVSVLDVVTLLGVIAVFALIGLIAKGVEKL